MEPATKSNIAIPVHSLLPNETGIEIEGWTIKGIVKPISGCKEIDSFEALHNMKCPEMIFLSNSLSLFHKPSGLCLQFSPQHALMGCLLQKKGVNVPLSSSMNEDEEVRCIDADLWAKREEMDSKRVAKGALGEIQKLEVHYDWTYSSLYVGDIGEGEVNTITTVPPPTATASIEEVVDGEDEEVNTNVLCPTCQQSNCIVQRACTSLPFSSPSGATVNEKVKCFSPVPTSLPFNMALLTRPDPILFYTSLFLFDDELHDNGISQCSLKVRVMPTCFLVLLRHFVRVDGVLVRLKNVRYFHEFSTPDNSSSAAAGKLVLVQEESFQDTFAALTKKGYPASAKFYSDPDKLVQKKVLTPRGTAMYSIALHPTSSSSSSTSSAAGCN